ncbi:MoaD/ThiS family protein [Trueperella bialowiezensis]|uniref:MoaD family protein n=1 Tax=Trueperella bialowiezensis TaxID=312285 RepID=A0A448PE21_9ACTO|nr:MoaD/ThiS family protein [Trueperella bialowiezensis]VEI13181.1 MoaD family protein [Trueperella bialowiezensis]
MIVNVRYFAAAAAYAGVDAERFDLADGASVGDLVAAIKAKHDAGSAPDAVPPASEPGAGNPAGNERLSRVLELSSFLVNGVRAESADVLPADADVDVLPPFAGGSPDEAQ